MYSKTKDVQDENNKEGMSADKIQETYQKALFTC